MALSSGLVDREHDKFVSDAEGLTAVRTILSGMTPRVDYDSIVVDYTDSTKEFISLVTVKLAASTVFTITFTYPSSTQEVFTWA